MLKNRFAASLRQTNNIWLLILLVAGTLTWSVTMFKSGIAGDYGIGFWGANGHDGIWHLALARQIAKGNFVMPTFGGASLQNYHTGFDLFLAFLHLLTRMDLVNLYFQVLPPILALLIGVLTYKLVLAWGKSKSSALWSTFFVYFGGSLGWLVNLLRGNGIGGESMFWAQQSISTLINPPFVLSLILVLSGLIFLIKYQTSRSIVHYLLSIVFLGVLIQVKVYAGLLVLGGLLVAGVWQWRNNKDLLVVKVFGGALVLSLVLFMPFNKNASGLIVYQPFWFLETMMGLSDRLGWPRFFSAMTSYRSGGNLLKGVPAYLVAFLIFWYGNMGTRFISEIAVFKAMRDKKADFVMILVYSMILAGGLIPIFFLQEGTPWNTIQFFYYSLFFSGILAGVAMGGLSFKIRSVVQSVVPVGIVLLSVPTTIATLKDVYIPSRPPAMLSQAEMEALDFLSQQTNGIVLTYPFDQGAADAAIANPPRPLYLYESTAYVSAFSGQQTFLEDEVNLNITNYPWTERREEILEFYATPDQDVARSFLQDNEIKYVYWVNGQRAMLGESQLGLEKIFENDEVSLYLVL